MTGRRWPRPLSLKNRSLRLAEGLRAKLEQEERNFEALTAAIGAADKNVRRVIADNLPSWRRQLMRDLFRASQRYKSAIAELEPSRDALNDETAIISYLTGHGGVAGGTNSLAGRIGYIDSKPR